MCIHTNLIFVGTISGVGYKKAILKNVVIAPFRYRIHHLVVYTDIIAFLVVIACTLTKMC